MARKGKRRRCRRDRRRMRRGRNAQKKFNNHHLLWERKRWTKHAWANKLRTHPYYIVRLPAQAVHRVIHEELSHIPVANEALCRYAYEVTNIQLEAGTLNYDDKPTKRLMVLIRVFEGASEPTAKALREQQRIFQDFKGGW